MLIVCGSFPFSQLCLDLMELHSESYFLWFTYLCLWQETFYRMAPQMVQLYYANLFETQYLGGSSRQKGKSGILGALPAGSGHTAPIRLGSVRACGALEK